MKISKNTLSILSSFTVVNNSIVVNRGNILATVNTGKEKNNIIKPLNTFMVRVEVPETFMMDFTIGDLKKFLAVISTFDDPDFDFQYKYVSISEKNQSIKYQYTGSNIIKVPIVDSVPYSETWTEFIIDAKMITTLKKISTTMRHDDLYIRTVDGKVEVVLTTTNQGTDANENEYIINTDKESEKDFSIKASMTLFTGIISNKDDYSLKVVFNGTNNFIILEGLGDTKIFYYIACKR
jgi:hypothetical protein